MMCIYFRRAVDMGENIWAYYMTRGNLKKTDEGMAQEAVDAWWVYISAGLFYSILLFRDQFLYMA